MIIVVSITATYSHLTSGMGVSIKLVLALLGKSAVAASFAVVYLYSAELCATCLYIVQEYMST